MEKKFQAINSVNKPNGVYAVTATGELIASNDAAVDATCLGVALITDNQRIMIEKNGEANAEWNGYETLLWGRNLFGKKVNDITNASDKTSVKADFEGRYNTNTIIKAYIQHGVEMDTRDMCQVLQNFNVGKNNMDFSDWYVPAAGQLYEIYIYVNEINKTLDAMGGRLIDTDLNYWSSSEFNDLNAWGLYFYSGFVNYYYSKDYGYRVRFIRDI